MHIESMVPENNCLDTGTNDFINQKVVEDTPLYKTLSTITKLAIVVSLLECGVITGLMGAIELALLSSGNRAYKVGDIRKYEICFLWCKILIVFQILIVLAITLAYVIVLVTIIHALSHGGV